MWCEMMRIAGIFSLILGFVLSVSVSGLAHDMSVFGIWETEGGKSRILVHPCEDHALVCGRLVWTPEGKRVGETILSDFSPQGTRLKGGRIHDPRTGKTYKARLEMAKPDRLKVKGCWFIFCGNQSWTLISDSLDSLDSPVDFLEQDVAE